MLVSSFDYGRRRITQQPGLVLLVYLASLVPAALLGIPVYYVLEEVVGPSGFGPELLAQFDIVLWADIMGALGNRLGLILVQLLWVVPLYMIVKVALQVGLVHALRDGGVRPFWAGVGRFTGRGLMVALLYAGISLAGAIALILVAVALAATDPSEVATFWIFFVLLPTLCISGVAILDLMHDYSRIAVVVEEQRVFSAFTLGLLWPFQHGQASWLYLRWFVMGAALLLLPTLIEFGWTAVWGLFLVQQLVLLLRAAVTVGWIGSEVYLFEQIRERERPLIADTTPNTVDDPFGLAPVTNTPAAPEAPTGLKPTFLDLDGPSPVPPADG